MMANLFDHFYGRDRKGFYYAQPSTKIQEIVEAGLIKPCRTLDIGCGDGRNSVYLAEKGFDVFAFDQSSTGILKLVGMARQQGLEINSRTCDLREFAPDGDFGLIIATTVLDHLPRNEIANHATRISHWLEEGGYLFATAFTVDDPGFFSQKFGTYEAVSETSSAVVNYFERNELLHIFKDLHILWYCETLEDDISHGLPHKHGIARLLARKQKNNVRED